MTKGYIASVTQQPSDFTSLMVVINTESGGELTADSTSSLLFIAHGYIFFYLHAVTTL